MVSINCVLLHLELVTPRFRYLLEKGTEEDLPTGLFL